MRIYTEITDGDLRVEVIAEIEEEAIDVKSCDGEVFYKTSTTDSIRGNLARNVMEAAMDVAYNKRLRG